MLMLIPDDSTVVEFTTRDGTQRVIGNTVIFVPPGKSSMKVIAPGRIYAMFTSRSDDLVAKLQQQGPFSPPQSLIVAPVVNWPEPKSGFKRASAASTFRRRGAASAASGAARRFPSWSTSSIITMDRAMRPSCRRNIMTTSSSARSPSQASSCTTCAGRGSSSKNNWMKRPTHELWGTPSIAIIPPPSIHTTLKPAARIRNQLVDIFCPPRMDFLAEAPAGS